MLQIRAVTLFYLLSACVAFQVARLPTAKAIPQTNKASDFALFMERNDKASTTKENSAEELLVRARKLREEIEASQATRPVKTASENTALTQNTLPWSLQSKENDATAYRFYLDIGREEGTWMEPRFGASGQRIEFTLDVCFTTQPVDRKVAEQMVQDNRGASSSPVYCLDTAPFARLRGGFDRMKCQPGAYRIDTSGRGQKTLRLFFHTEGKKSGDVYIPDDSKLYISLPVLADSSLSRKEGIVSIRQYGWKTGWYRLESRILGVVRAVPLTDAQANDKF